MTVKQLFEASAIELNKVQAPTLKLFEFNHLCNKAINNYVNKVYNIYDINQQSTDDLRVLKSTAYLTPSEPINKSKYGKNSKYEISLPLDYLHLLNCVCIYKVLSNKYCYDKDDIIEIPATKLTADSWSRIMTDVYNKPSPLNPYYYIHNVNTSQTETLTNPHNSNNITGTDLVSNHKEAVLLHLNETSTFNSIPMEPMEPMENYENIYNQEELENKYSLSFPRSFKLQNSPIEIYSKVEKEANSRIGNPTQIRCEIRCGNDDSVFKLLEVQIDYIKVPQNIRLTQNQLDLTTDTSQILEFPDYVCQEILNELVHLVMERSSNPRLSTHIQMNQTIARPTQQQPQQTN